MGASESTERSNGTQKEEEERRQESGGTSTGAAAAITMAATGAAVAAWGISRMLSDNRNTEETNYLASGNIQDPDVTYCRGEPDTYNGVHSRVLWLNECPFQGPFKMNTDGACRPVKPDPTDTVLRGPSGYGGILRDHNGEWVRGFRGFIGVTDCLTAEFHGIYKGLLFLDQLRLEESVLESDSAAAIEWINHDEKLYRRKGPIIKNCWDMIMECKRLINKNRITIRCCSREANKCADKLANMGIDRGQELYMEIIDLPVEIKDIVDRESSMY